MDRRFRGVFMPSVVRGLALVIVDVNSRNVDLLLIVSRRVEGNILLLC